MLDAENGIWDHLIGNTSCRSLHTRDICSHALKSIAISCRTGFSPNAHKEELPIVYVILVSRIAPAGRAAYYGQHLLYLLFFWCLAPKVWDTIEGFPILLHRLAPAGCFRISCICLCRCCLARGYPSADRLRTIAPILMVVTKDCLIDTMEDGAVSTCICALRLARRA